VPDHGHGAERQCKADGGSRFNREAPIGESHVGPKKFLLVTPGFTRQAVSIR